MHSRKPPTAPAGPPSVNGCAPTPPLMEFEETLKRLVDRIAKILQAEKCVFLLHDPVAGTLYATHPALGFTREQLLHLERRISEDGLSADVFRNNTPVILYDAAHDPRAAAEGLAQYGIRNAVSVPLIVEKRDDENKVQERTTVGVLHVFNKKGGEIFVTEDVGLMERMAMTAAAVIASAQMYREVIQEKQELIHTIDSLYAGLLVVGNNGRVVQINPSARAILDLPPTSPSSASPSSASSPTTGCAPCSTTPCTGRGRANWPRRSPSPSRTPPRRTA